MNETTILYKSERSNQQIVGPRFSTEVAPVRRALSPLVGIWISDLGARYLCDGGGDGGEFVCLSIGADARFKEWITRVAIRIKSQTDDAWYGVQAIRDLRTGELCRWVPLRVTVQGDVLTKFFSSTVPGELLVHGHIEQYRRVRLD